MALVCPKSKNMKILIGIIMMLPSLAFADLPFSKSESIRINITSYDSGNLRGGLVNSKNKLYITAALNPDGARHHDDANIVSSDSTRVPYFESVETSEELVISGRQLLDAAARVEWPGDYNLRVKFYESNIGVDEFLRSAFIPMSEISETPRAYEINDGSSGASVSFTVQKIGQN